MSLLKREPLVILGIVASAALAAAQSLAGNGVIGADVMSTISAALSPDGGWLLPLVALIVGRFLVYSPATYAAK